MTDLPEAGVRPPGVAGFFYPSEARRLAEVVAGFLAVSESGPAGQSVGGEYDPAAVPAVDPPVAIVAPHAGYDYSGAVAGRAYAALAGHGFDRAVVIAPSHLEAFSGATIFPGTAYRTPLGECPIDTDLSSAIVAAAAGVVRPGLEGHWLAGSQRQEHALEVQLPFLQAVMGSDIPIVPIVLGESAWPVVETLGRGIAAAVRESDGGSTIVVASTDLSHFHADSRAEEIDARTLDLVTAFDPQALMDGLRCGRGEACGGAPVATVMVAARELGASRAAVLDYTHSGRVAGDSRSVVGYAAIRFD